MENKIVLDAVLRKLPSTRKEYRVCLFVPDNGIPYIEYHQLNSKQKPKKTIPFVDLLFADRKYEKGEKFAFSLFKIDKTITFLAPDESTMMDWLCKIREAHSNLFPEFKRYDIVFEANLMHKGLAKTMNIHGPYRLALSKDTIDFIPVLNKTTIDAACNNSQEPNQMRSDSQSQQRSQQRFHKRHPLLRSKTIELTLRSIRRCGHSDCQFYIESGRHSQIGEGDLWMTLNKKSTVRVFHERLVNAMAPSNSAEDMYPPNKGPRSRSGSSNDNALKNQQSRSSSLVCLAAESESKSIFSKTSNNDLSDNNNVPVKCSNSNVTEDGYMHMS